MDCGSCHGGTYTNTAVDPDLHMNGVMDGGGEPDLGGINCGGCHGALFAAMNGGTSHISRHSLGAISGTNDSPDDSGVTWGSPLSSNAASARSCVNMCHSDHPHDLTNPVVTTHENNAYVDASTSATRANGTSSRTGANRTGADFDTTQTNGGLCTSCHRNPVDAARPAIDKAAYDASAHNDPSGQWSYQLHDGGLFARNCTRCHASSSEGNTPQAPAGGAAVHYADEPSLLSGATNPAGIAAGFVCYNCHGSAASPADGAQGNRSGKDIQSQIAHATTAGESGHPSVSDSVHDSASEHASATFGNALGVPAGSSQRHASCLDCHDPHQASSGTHSPGTNVAGPPLAGTWGAKLATNPSFWTAPTSGDFVKTTIVAGTDPEATLCFKCHSSYYWGTGTPPTSPGLGEAQTDVAKEFNPANAGDWASAGTANQWSAGETAGSFHPVLASVGNNLGVTNNIKSPWTTTSLMTCTDCHESDQTTDPNGPHGSAAKFVLKGPATAWDNTIVSGSSMPSNVFCSNCHNTSWSTGRFPAHSVSNHRIPCFNCHSAIPHGAPRPGLLNPTAGTDTTNLPAIPDYDSVAPYAQPGTGARLYLMSYPVGRTSSWSVTYCGCNGTTHR